jgi:pyruvate dehydrogenase E2 component (dihydrolipoamide acetyltransferase)
MQQQVAANMQRSWLNVPHVTQHDLADITDMEEFRQSLKAEAGQRGVKLTPLAFIVRAVCHALAQKPKFNSSLHPDGQHLIVKEYINVGIATNTAEGLLVPVIRGADRKGLWELSENIAELAEKARDKKLALDDLGGGTFTVSSLGSIGGTGFTPIVNAPEVAILGVGRLTTQPQWNGEEFLPRQMLPLSLSYDHRVINGVDGGEFMQLLSQLLSDVRRLAL